jgi:hypothetical protein
MSFMEDYRLGELSGVLYACDVAIPPARSAANRALSLSIIAKPSGQAALDMVRHAATLEEAAAVLRQAAALAYPKPALLQAAE